MPDWLAYGGCAMIMIGMLAAIPVDAAPESSWDDILSKDAKLELLEGDFQFTEGPVWTREGTLIFSDIPADTLYEWKGKGGKPHVFRQPSHNANGNTLDKQGHLLSCEHGSRTVTRTEKDGTVTTLAEKFEGKRLNSPNDIVVKSNGDLYFTDPPYGIRKEQEELGLYGVYRLTPNGELTLLVKDFVKPNGLAFSPDEKRLYVDDSDNKHIRVFDVLQDGTLTNGRVFAELKDDKPGVPDGMKVDSRGNVYCTGPGGIHVFTPSGTRLGVIATPEVAANCAWGDADFKTLYITASKGLYRIRLKIAGIRP